MWNNPNKRSLHNEGPLLQTQRALLDNETEPLLSQNDVRAKTSTPHKNPTEKSNKNNTHVPVRHMQKLRVDPDQSKKKNSEKRPANGRSTQTRLQDVDPAAISVLQGLNGQNNGDPGTAAISNLVAPGAAIFLLDGNLINLSAKCVKALSDILNYVNRSHPTAIARIVFQIWLWGLTIWGLLLESIPHIGAVAASHVLNTAFLALNLRSINLRSIINLKEDFENVVNNDCDGVDVLPSFWQFLFQLDLVAVVFSAITVLAFAILGFKLYSVLDWRTFKKLGASRIVRMAHTFSLIFAAIVQLNAYFVVVFLSLWLNEVLSHHWKAGSQNIQNTLAFKVTLGILLGLSIPWLLVGNLSLKKEHILGLIVFFVFDVALHTFTIFLLCQKFYQNMAKLRFTGIMACIRMFSSLWIAVACLLVFDRSLLSKVNRESNGNDESYERPNMNDDEVAFPNNDVKPYNYQKSETSGSGIFPEKRNSVTSLIPVTELKPVLSSRMDYIDHSQNMSSLESQTKNEFILTGTGTTTGTGNDKRRNSSFRQSWMEGDEIKWIAPVVERPRRQSHLSITSGSSDAFSYATTTMSSSKSSSFASERKNVLKI